VRQIANNFIAFLASDLLTTAEDQQKFFYFNNSRQECIIDTQIYSNFRCIRMLYSSKLKSKNSKPLVPYKQSSPHIHDHLFLIHKECTNVITFTQLHESPLDIKIDSSKLGIVFSKLQTAPLSQSNAPISQSISNGISKIQLAKVEKAIHESTELHDILRCKHFIFESSGCSSTNKYKFNIKKSCNVWCPYGNRVHKHNNSYFEYNHDCSIVWYNCYDEDCIKKVASREVNTCFLRFYDATSTLEHVNNIKTHKTLHCQEQIIKWDESYSANSMQEYPVSDIVCVRANMGTGKTVGIISFLQQHANHPSTKCLVITYSRTLSNKYHAAFSSLGFINYLDKKGQYEHSIYDNKVIVCLDSLGRVKTENFHFVIIDEVLSVLMHFNSPFIKSDIICKQFELLLLQSNHIYMLDAHADNLIVYNFVRYLAEKRNNEPYYIRNTYVRPSNRKAQVIVNKTKKYATALKQQCIDQIANLVNKGKRVVIATTSLNFTKMLESELRMRFKTPKNIQVYNSETDNALKREHSLNPEPVWKTLDVLIYSPTISAGVSFEVEHFDYTIAFMECNIMSPTIDLSLQQLFRVRCLRNNKNANMFIYVNNFTTYNTTKYPIAPKAIDEWLNRNITDIDYYYPDNSLSFTSPTSNDTTQIEYDRTRMSYYLLHGIVYNKNISLTNYVSILVNTLKQDYKIPVKITIYEPPGTRTNRIRIYWSLFAKVI
jgi:hypothetical protein